MARVNINRSPISINLLSRKTTGLLKVIEKISAVEPGLFSAGDQFTFLACWCMYIFVMDGGDIQ